MITITIGHVIVAFIFLIIGFRWGRSVTSTLMCELVWQIIVYVCDGDEKKAMEKWINFKRTCNQDISVKMARLRNKFFQSPKM